MARAIDVEKAIEIIEEKQKQLCPVGRYGRNYVYGSDREKYDAWEEIIDALDNLPTLSPPNEPLTWEHLQKMDGPVWVACKPIEGGNGYWCLCQRGHIITPAGSIFDVKEIPHWVFYRRPLEGEEDT